MFWISNKVEVSVVMYSMLYFGNHILRNNHANKYWQTSLKKAFPIKVYGVKILSDRIVSNIHLRREGDETNFK